MKKFLSMVKLGLILAAFATAACVMLAFVYNGTSAVIEQRKRSDLEASLKEIFPDAEGFEEIDGIKSPDAAVTIEIAYAVKKNNEVIGTALRLSRAGYSGPIKILTGISINGEIRGVRILEHTDTPGLGANAASPSYFVDRVNRITFYGQFTGKSINDPFEVKKDVAVITASTITSRAIADSVKAAGMAAKAWFTGIEVDVISGTTGGGR
jgi:electron transport complex protein RnfG